MASKCKTYAGGRAWWSAFIRMSARRVALALTARSGEKPGLDDLDRALSPGGVVTAADFGVG